MAQQQIITKPYVEELQDNDSLFINHNGALRQLKKNKTGFATKEDLEGKVDKETGKGLSTNDYTNAEKSKLADLENYDDAEVRGLITGLQTSKADKTDLTKTDRRLNALYELTQGQAWDFDRDNNNAYSVDVPSGSHYASIDMVGGKSVVWNQLVTEKIAAANNGYTAIAQNSIYVFNGTSTSINAAFSIKLKNNQNHKYLISLRYISGSIDGGYLQFSTQSWGVSTVNEAVIFTNTSENDYWYYVFKTSDVGVVMTDYTVVPQLFDLTQIFGAGNEPATVEEFEAMFPLDYYPYCEPTIISSQNDRVDVRGKNLFNNGEVTVYSAYLRDNGDGIAPSWQYSDDSKSIRIPCEPNTTYTISLSVKSLIFRVGSTLSDLAPLTWDNTVPLTQRIDSPNSKSVTYTTGESDKYLIVQVGFSTMDKFISDGQIEKGSTATDYKPYSLQQITTGFPVLNSADDVYDYIDLNEGKLYTWTYIEDNEVKALAEPIIKPINIPSELADWLTVEAGGSITFHNADEGKRLLIPSIEEYLVKLSEVVSNG